MIIAVPTGIKVFSWVSFVLRIQTRSIRLCRARIDSWLHQGSQVYDEAYRPILKSALWPEPRQKGVVTQVVQDSASHSHNVLLSFSVSCS